MYVRVQLSTTSDETELYPPDSVWGEKDFRHHISHRTLYSSHIPGLEMIIIFNNVLSYKAVVHLYYKYVFTLLGNRVPIGVLSTGVGLYLLT